MDIRGPSILEVLLFLTMLIRLYINYGEGESFLYLRIMQGIPKSSYAWLLTYGIINNDN
jgi:hypothetical protein